MNWISSLDSMQRWLRDLGIDVIILRNQPDIDPLLYPEASLARKVLKLPMQTTVRIVASEREVAGWVAELDLVRLRGGGAADLEVVDTWKILCPRAMCVLWQDGLRIYEDRTHLSSIGAMMLSPTLQVALSKAGG